MICDTLPSLLGIDCTPIDEAGSIALVETPFCFADGETSQVFVRTEGDEVVFFDDGAIVWHFLGRGLQLQDDRRCRFLQRVGAENGVTVTADFDFEARGPLASAPALFARFVGMLMSFSRWEREHTGADMDAVSLVDEVAELLQRLPHESFARDVELIGFSRQAHKIDFLIDGEAILAVRPRARFVNAALRKILDVKNALENANYRFRVVLDDRQHPGAAQADAAVLSTVAKVSSFRALEPQASRLH